MIAHGGGSGKEVAKAGGISQKKYKKVVNDPIADALNTIQLKLIPFSDEWNTGIVVPPMMNMSKDSGQSLDQKIG